MTDAVATKKNPDTESDSAPLVPTVKHNRIESKETVKEPNLFKEYDSATLALHCPVCQAAPTSKCLYHEAHGAGTKYSDTPHQARVTISHNMSEEEAEAYILEHEIQDLEAQQEEIGKQITELKKKQAADSAVQKQEERDAAASKPAPKKA
jgi:hypothetical protein